MFQTIYEPEKVMICPFDGCDTAGVYVGFLDAMRLVTDELDWRVDKTSEMTLVPYKELSLSEIKDQVRKKTGENIITVIVNRPLSGIIYQYGNHGDLWEQVGVLCGYA